jgi:hypothetical protein
MTLQRSCHMHSVVPHEIVSRCLKNDSERLTLSLAVFWSHNWKKFCQVANSCIVGLQVHLMIKRSPIVMEPNICYRHQKGLRLNSLLICFCACQILTIFPFKKWRTGSDPVPASYPVGAWGHYVCRSAKLISHLHLLVKTGMRGAFPPRKGGA